MHSIVHVNLHSRSKWSHFPDNSVYSVKIGGISRKTVAIYDTINFGAINLLLQKMEQFYGARIWYHLMAPFYGMYVPGLTDSDTR